MFQNPNNTLFQKIKEETLKNFKYKDGVLNDGCSKNVSQQVIFLNISVVILK